MTARDPFSKSSLFQQALKGILRPLIRALIAQGVTAPAFYQIVKRTYVEVAEEELKGAATDSAISVATGVHRRDVKALRAPEDGDQASQRRRISTLATVVGRWLSDPNLVDESGQPIPLPRNGPQSFDVLVEGVSRDVRPRAVLDELIRQNIVETVENKVVLKPEALVGPANQDQKVHFFALNLGDHMHAAVDNLLNDTPPFLERAVFYNLLTADSVRRIEEQARGLGVELLHRLNAEARMLQEQDRSDPDATQRFRFGVFFFSEDQAGALDGSAQADDEDGGR